MKPSDYRSLQHFVSQALDNLHSAKITLGIPERLPEMDEVADLQDKLQKLQWRLRDRYEPKPVASSKATPKAPQQHLSACMQDDYDYSWSCARECPIGGRS